MSREKKKPAPKKGAGKQTKQKKPPKRKNVSQTIPNGRTLQTRDEFFQGDGAYRKPGYKDKGFYRKVVVVDSNRDNELAVIKLTTSKKGECLPDYQKGKSKYRPFISTKDDENKPIKIGRKFLPNKPRKDVSKKDVDKMKKDAIKHKENKSLLRRLKNRK